MSRGPMAIQRQLRAMVCNRLCAPDSKPGCLRWLETMAMPAIPKALTFNHILRATDALMDHAVVSSGAQVGHFGFGFDVRQEGAARQQRSPYSWLWLATLALRCQ